MVSLLRKNSVFSGSPGVPPGMFPRSLKQVQETKAAWKAFESPQMPRDVPGCQARHDEV